MKTLYRLILLLAISSLTHRASAQQKPVQDSVKRKQREFYKRELNIDSVKAAQVSAIQDTYKAGMKTLMQERGLTPEVRSQRIKALMDEKNRQLSGLLTPQQQAKIIPTTERLPLKKQ